MELIEMVFISAGLMTIMIVFWLIGTIEQNEEGRFTGKWEEWGNGKYLLYIIGIVIIGIALGFGISYLIDTINYSLIIPKSKD